jgi:uncharacterized membrane protein YfcA
MSPILVLQLALAAFAVYWLLVFVRGYQQAKSENQDLSVSPITLAVSAVANFFDTLGIGSFATTTAAIRKWKLVPDEHIPGTLNVGYVPPTILQAFLFTTAVNVDPKTLILMIIAAVVGARFGAGVFSRWPRRKIQLGMGFALYVAALLMTYKALEGDPVGGTTLALTGPKLVIGLIGNFVLGILMTIGIGLYGPCMILVSLLGMDPKAAFPIMMGSCAFLMPVASGRFVKERSVNMKGAFALAIGGLPFVWVAAKWVTNFPINWVRWLVVVVVLYAGTTLLLAARREREKAEAAAASGVAQPIAGT